MRFVNHTPLPSALVPCAEGGDDLTALVLACITYAIVPVAEGKTRTGSGLRIAYEQRPLERGAARIEPGDDVFVVANGFPLFETADEGGLKHVFGGSAGFETLFEEGQELLAAIEEALHRFGRHDGEPSISTPMLADWG